MGALAAVASRSDLIMDLVVSDKHAGRGLYTFHFFKHAAWCPVGATLKVGEDPRDMCRLFWPRTFEAG